MSRTTNESEDEMLSKDQADSPSIDEGIYDGSLGGGGVILKKGPWTSSEDAILVDYVKKHGEGNWNAVQKHSGLSRCGKSCRLRWANHLRPNLKKGAFTPDEERLIIELHAKMGNKWARMAANLPGRTDNEIKNYWNTRIKRRQRAGLPLYPPDLCFQALNDSQQTHNASEFNSGNMAHHDLFQANNYGIPNVIFDDLKGNQGGVLCHAAALSDTSVSQHMLTQGLGSSQTHNFNPPTMRHPKRIRESESLFPGFTSNLTNGLPPIDQFQTDTCDKIICPFGLSFPYDPDPNSKNPSPFGGISGSHALLNGNFSTSKPIPRALKMELPSLQYPETDLGSWGMLNPQLPSLESVEAFIQTPSPTRLLQSDCPSPRNSGLLEALLHESQTLNSTKNHSSEKSTSSSVVTPSDIMDSSTLNIHETGWEEYGDPISPLGCSSASVFSECTAPISGSSLDEYLPVKPLYGPSIKIETVEHESTPEGEKELSMQLDFSRPDALLGAGWFEQGSECGNGQSTVNDAIATLLGDDFCSGYKPSWGLGSYPWNNVPAVCQMSELP